MRARLLLVPLAAFLLATLPLPGQDDVPRPAVLFETTEGEFTIELFADKTPRTAANFLRYVEGNRFDDTIFHRVIPKFMVQGGGFTPELELKPTLPPINIETRRDLPTPTATAPRRNSSSI